MSRSHYIIKLYYKFASSFQKLSTRHATNWLVYSLTTWCRAFQQKRKCYDRGELRFIVCKSSSHNTLRIAKQNRAVTNAGLHDIRVNKWSYLPTTKSLYTSGRNSTTSRPPPPIINRRRRPRAEILHPDRLSSKTTSTRRTSCIAAAAAPSITTTPCRRRVHRMFEIHNLHSLTIFFDFCEGGGEYCLAGFAATQALVSVRRWCVCMCVKRWKWRGKRMRWDLLPDGKEDL